MQWVKENKGVGVTYEKAILFMSMLGCITCFIRLFQ